jgi:hypothetical protein
VPNSTNAHRTGAATAASRLDIPDWMEPVFEKFLTTTLSTVSKKGTPSAVPVTAFYDRV